MYSGSSELSLYISYCSYIYTDDVDHQSIANDNNATIDLHYAAKKYMLPKLEQICIKNLENYMKNDTVCSILTYSMTYSYDKLHQR